MKIRCRIGLHKWDGCKCPDCFKRRDKKHSWDGCKCTRCGKVRNEEHFWNGCKCTRCGRVRDEGHFWDGCKCTCCGKVRDKEHFWNGCTCTICGKTRHIWEHTGEESEYDFTEGVDRCTENMCLMEEFWYDIYECTQCGATMRKLRE